MIARRRAVRYPPPGAHRPAVRLRQDRDRRARSRPPRPGVGSAVERGDRAERSPKRGFRSPTSPSARASRPSSVIGWSRCTRRCTAASSPTPTIPTIDAISRSSASSRSPSWSSTCTRSAQEPGVELIDVGGPAMVRAAAKNHAHVGVVVDPADYEPVLAELRAGGRLSGPTRRRLARTAFARTAAYDTEIVAWLDDTGPRPADEDATTRICSRLRCAWTSSGRSRCATARTRTSRRPATASAGRPGGGTPPPSTAARRSAT